MVKGTEAGGKKNVCKEIQRPLLKDRFAGCDVRTCNSCSQKTSSVDRDSPAGDPKFLAWVKTMSKVVLGKFRRTTKSHPSGHECYPCFFVRRKLNVTVFKQKKKTQAELDEDRKLDAGLDEQFWTVRRKNVTGEDKITEIADETNHEVDSNKDAYDDRFKCGSFEPIDEFADSRKISYEDEDKLCEIIEAKYPQYELKYDKDGVLGVMIPDTTGRKYRYQTGLRDSNTFRKRESCGDKADAKELFGLRVDKRAHKAEMRTVQPVTVRQAAASDGDGGDGDQNSDGDYSDGGTHSLASAQTQPLPGQATPRDSRGRRTRSSAPSVAGDRRIDGGRPGGRQPGPELQPSPRSVNPIASVPQPLVDDDGDGDTKGRRSLAERTHEDASGALDKTLGEFNPNSHASIFSQTKRVEGAVKKMQKWGKKVGAIEDLPAQELSQRCFDAADLMEQRQVLFEDLTSRFIDCVGDISESCLSLLGQIDATHICKFVTKGCAALMDPALREQAAATCLYNALALKSSSQGFGLRITLAKDLPAVLICQKTGLLAFAEKALKQNVLVNVVESLANLTRPVSVLNKKRLANDIASFDVNCEDTLHGWHPQLWVDLICLYTLASVGWSMIKSTKQPRDVSNLVLKVIGRSSIFSPRVKCYLKVGSSASPPPVAQIWRYMEQITNEPVVGECPVTIDSPVAWIKILTDSGDHFVECGDAVIAVIDGDDRTGLRNFVKYTRSLGAEVEGEEKEMRDKAEELKVLLLNKYAVVLDNLSYHTSVLNDSKFLYTGGVLEDVVEAVSSQDVEKQVRDAAYYADQENLPDDVAMMYVTSALASLLSEYDLHTDLLAEVMRNITLHVDFWKIMHFDVAGEVTEVSKFRRMTEIYRQSVWSSGHKTPVVDGGDPYICFQTFLRKARSSERFENHLCAKIVELVSRGGPTASATTHELCVLKTSLPPRAEAFVRAALDFEAIEDVAKRIKSGQSAPMLAEMHEVLNALRDGLELMPDIMESRPVLRQSEEVTCIECEAGIDALEKKLLRFEEARAGIDLWCKQLYKAIDTWSFAALPFLSKKKEDPDCISFVHKGKLLQQYKAQFENMKAVGAKLAAKMSWMTAQLQLRVKAFAGFFQEATQKALAETVKILAHAMVVNVLITHKDVEDKSQWPVLAKRTIDYCSRDLYFPLEEFHPALSAHIFPSKKKIAHKAPPAEQSTETDSIASWTDSSTTASSSDPATKLEPKLKKLKTFAKK